MGEILSTHECKLPEYHPKPMTGSKLYTRCDECGQFYGSGYASKRVERPDTRKWWQKFFTPAPGAERIELYSGWWHIDPIVRAYVNGAGDVVNADGTPFIKAEVDNG